MRVHMLRAACWFGDWEVIGREHKGGQQFHLQEQQ